ISACPPLPSFLFCTPLKTTASHSFLHLYLKSVSHGPLHTSVSFSDPHFEALCFRQPVRLFPVFPVFLPESLFPDPGRLQRSLPYPVLRQYAPFSSRPCQCRNALHFPQWA